MNEFNGAAKTVGKPKISTLGLPTKIAEIPMQNPPLVLPFTAAFRLLEVSHDADVGQKKNNLKNWLKRPKMHGGKSITHENKKLK